LILVGGCGGAAKPDTATPAPSNTAMAMDEDVVSGSAEHAQTPVDEQSHDETIAAAQAAGVLGNTNPAPSGDLDRDSIRSVVRSNIQAITYCYEKRLLDVPDLAGTTTVNFTIAPDGKVEAASGAGFDPAVDACVADLVKTFAFPPPKGGGSVQVSYPFVFRPS